MFEFENEIALQENALNQADLWAEFQEDLDVDDLKAWYDAVDAQFDIDEMYDNVHPDSFL